MIIKDRFTSLSSAKTVAGRIRTDDLTDLVFADLGCFAVAFGDVLSQFSVVCQRLR
jgi:hypothetical protein